MLPHDQGAGPGSSNPTDSGSDSRSKETDESSSSHYPPPAFATTIHENGGNDDEHHTGDQPLNKLASRYIGDLSPLDHLDRIQAGLYILDSDWNFVYLNDRAQELINPDGADLLGKNVWEEFPAAEDLSFGPKYREAMETQEPVDFIEHYPTLDAWFSVQAYPDNDGLSVYFRDITHSHRERQRLKASENINRAIRDLTHSIINLSTREEVEARVCRRVAAIDANVFAWIGVVNYTANTITPTHTAGDHHGYLADIAIELSEDGPQGNHPAAVALRENRPVYINDALNDPRCRTFDSTLRTPYKSKAAIPITYNDITYSVLVIYNAQKNAFEEWEREALNDLGGEVAHTLHSIEQRRALTGETVLRVRFHNDWVADTLRKAAIDPEGEVYSRVDRAVTHGDDIHVFFEAGGVDPYEFAEQLRGLESALGVSVLSHSEETHRARMQMTVGDESFAGYIINAGGMVQAMTTDADGVDVTADLPPSVDLRGLLERINAIYPETEIVGKRTVERTQASVSDIHSAITDTLTEKQQAVLQTAYAAGYFDWPRGATGEDVAEMLGMSPSTFSQHIRASERRILDVVFTPTAEE